MSAPAEISLREAHAVVLEQRERCIGSMNCLQPKTLQAIDVLLKATGEAFELVDAERAEDACLLQRLGEFNGDFLIWCGPGNQGYTSDLAKAGVFTRAEAEKIQRRCPDAVRVWSKAEAHGTARLAVHNEDIIARFMRGQPVEKVQPAPVSIAPEKPDPKQVYGRERLICLHPRTHYDAGMQITVCDDCGAGFDRA